MQQLQSKTVQGAEQVLRMEPEDNASPKFPKLRHIFFHILFKRDVNLPIFPEDKKLEKSEKSKCFVDQL